MAGIARTRYLDVRSVCIRLFGCLIAFRYEDCIANNSYPHIANINFKWFNSDLLAGSKYRDMTHMTCTLTGRKIPIEFSKQELIPILDGTLFSQALSLLSFQISTKTNSTLPCTPGTGTPTPETNIGNSY